MKKPWKIAFFTLVMIHVVIIGGLFFFLMQPSESTIPEPKATKGATFLIHAAKEDVNAFMNDYIQKKKKKGTLSYRVWVNDRVYIASEIELFGRNIPLTMSFLPNVVNGDIELLDPDLSLGGLHIPARYALNYLQTHVSLPDDVVIDPNHNRIYVAVTHMRLKNGYRLSVQSFDLAHDNIALTLTIPTK
ncbi:YpmS family protein [Anoxybacteroides amylolyticum]|uniref:DUF2140 family protein n=1 Tax=Anoxybacteroides amylolyticum TaxID=294699 RepID=A0A160F4Y3_9BACL|nr:YpmS family protein [Anoxybacillus amylolyticus]ANB61529.1 hypothetical protein GFC30_2081 [Anoxybacillus amylolyticus]